MVQKQANAKSRYAANIFVGLLVAIGFIMVMTVILNKVAEMLG